MSPEQVGFKLVWFAKGFSHTLRDLLWHTVEHKVSDRILNCVSNDVCNFAIDTFHDEWVNPSLVNSKLSEYDFTRN